MPAHSRPFYDLTPADFDEHLLWEQAGDEEWEPGKDEVLSDNQDSRFVSVESSSGFEEVEP